MTYADCDGHRQRDRPRLLQQRTPPTIPSSSTWRAICPSGPRRTWWPRMNHHNLTGLEIHPMPPNAHRHADRQDAPGYFVFWGATGIATGVSVDAGADGSIGDAALGRRRSRYWRRRRPGGSGRRRGRPRWDSGERFSGAMVPAVRPDLAAAQDRVRLGAAATGGTSVVGTGGSAGSARSGSGRERHRLRLRSRSDPSNRWIAWGTGSWSRPWFAGAGPPTPGVSS